MLQRLHGATAIELKVNEIALLACNVVPHCIWDLGQGMNHAGPHRLDVRVAHIEIRLYFTDRELMSYSDEKRLYDVDSRLIHALSKLFDA